MIMVPGMVHAWNHDHRVDQSVGAGAMILEETCAGSNPPNEARQYHQPGLLANVELHLNPFLTL